LLQQTGQPIDDLQLVAGELWLDIELRDWETGPIRETGRQTSGPGEIG
jgi:hypothetical protein